MADAAPPAAPVATPQPVQPSKPPAAPPAAADAGAAGASPSAEELVELVIDGQTEKLTSAELKRWASKAKFADKLTRQAKEALKATQASEAKRAEEEEKRKARARENTEEWLREHGVDPDEYARRRLEAKLKEQEMTPEQLEAAKAKAEAAELRKKVEKHDAERREAEVKARAQHIERLMVGELEAAAKKLAVTFEGDRFAVLHEVTKEWLELELPWNAERIVETAKAKLDDAGKRLRGTVLKGLKGQALIDELGPEAVEEVKAFLLAQYRKTRTPYGGTKPAAVVPQPVSSGPSYTTTAEADEQLRKMRDGVK